MDCKSRHLANLKNRCNTTSASTTKHLSDIVEGNLLSLASDGLIAESLPHKLALLLLDTEHTFFNGAFHDKSPDPHLAGLAKAMNTGHSLVLGCWRPP